MAAHWQPGGGLDSILAAMNAALAAPLALRWTEHSARFLLLFTLTYAVAAVVLVSDKCNTRPGAEHGSACWGDVSALNRKYRDKHGTNLLLTKHFQIGVDGEYRDELEHISDTVPYDRQEIETNDGVYYIRWQDVLAVFSSRVSGAADGAPIAALDEARLDELREILWDMNEVSYTTREETVEVSAQNANTEASRDTASESTANDSGARSQESNEADTTTITQTVLTIHLTHKTPEEMQTAYNFTARQAEYLTLLQDPEYETLWAELLGGFAAGDSEILTPDTTRTPTGSLQWPLPIPGSITSPFGYRTDPLTGETSYHDGTDIAAPEGTPILAAADGTVTVANALDSWGGSYGYYVQIDHGSGLQTLYAHCCQVCVTQGQQVQAGQVIAYVGHTGRATGNHLHFEVRENGERVDAMSYYGKFRA